MKHDYVIVLPRESDTPPVWYRVADEQIVRNAFNSLLRPTLLLALPFVLAALLGLIALFVWRRRRSAAR